MEQPPATAGIVMANWYWKVVRQFVSERFGISLSRSSCLNWLRRLGFAFKRPKKRLLKADAAKRETFVAEYAALVDEAQQVGAKVFFVDEAHFRADADPVSGYGAGSAGQMGAQRRASPGGLDQPALGRKGQLLFGGVPGNRRGGMDGTGGQQQLCNLRHFPAATAGAARGTADCDLG